MSWNLKSSKEYEPCKIQYCITVLIQVLSDGGMFTCLLCVVFVSAIKGIKFQRKHAKLSEYPLDEQLKILDTLGDLYCKAKAYQKALGCYKKEVY